MAAISSNLVKVLASKENNKMVSQNNTNKSTFIYKSYYNKCKKSYYKKETHPKKIKKSVKKSKAEPIADVRELEEKPGSRWKFTVGGLLNKQK